MKYFFLLFICVVFLAACGPSQAQSAAEPAIVSANAWIDTPLDGSLLPFAPMDVTSHFYHPSGISRVELSVNGSVLRTDPSPDTTTDFVHITQQWSPPAPGEYQLSVRAQSNNGEWGNTATVNVMIGDMATMTPVIRLTPTATLPPSATATPVGLPTLTLTKNAFCRKGPNVSFSDVTGITVGETVDIFNVSEDGFWYYIYWKKFDQKCWVAAGTGQVQGDLNGTAVLVGPALPTSKPPTAVPTATSFKP